MHWLRSKKVFRGAVAFLIATLLPVLVAPLSRAGGEATPEDYGEWLRGQVRVSVDDEAFEQAVAFAHEAEPESFSEFLSAFAAAYEKMGAERPLSDVLAVPNMSAEAVVAYLQKRLIGMRGVTLSPPSAVQTEKAAPADGPELTATARAFHRSISPSFLEPNGPLALMDALVVMPLHFLFVAQPRGP